MGTLYVNLTGCLLIGLIFGLGEYRGLNPDFRLFFITGFLGALTTFSTYGLETVNHVNKGSFDLALINIAVNNIGGLILVKAGLMLSRLV
jgi:CrcB protein